MPALSEKKRTLPSLQRSLADIPWEGVEEDYKRIYVDGKIEVGLPNHLFNTRRNDYVRDNTVAIIGAMFGDEGKGRFVDNKIATLLEKPQVNKINVIRFQGGNNAGHTLEKEDGTRIALHVIPSAILFDQARGIIDRGVIVHAEDLQTETEYAESYVGDLRNKVLLSKHALLCTDLERAEEILNRVKSGGAASGGTGRGIASTYSHHYDRLGLKVVDLIKDGWKKKLEDRYLNYEKEFASHGLEISQMRVPDFRKVKIEKNNDEAERTVGSMAEFIDRIESARNWLLSRKMTIDTTPLHREIFNDYHQGVLFEGAQGVGLNAWLGSYPDITASDTTSWGILAGTGYWRPDNVKEKIGILKGPYTSSVGSRHLPTEIKLERSHNELPTNPSLSQERGAYIRATANERGTTTGRWRDVANLDLANLAYNAVAGGVESFAVTMMDVARETDVIPVATHYEKNGERVPYEPGLEYMQNLTPIYIELPGWNGKEAAGAKTFEELPENAKKYLSFIQARTGVPVIAVTASPSRDKLITLPGYNI